MKYRSEARRKMVVGRLWTVYGATGDPSRPLRPIACVRANAKSIAIGKVARSPQYSHIGKRQLAAVEGCYTGGTVMRSGLGAHKPTIYEALRQKLGREPTNAELKADVKRIMQEALVETASRGRLPHQRRRR